MNSTPVIELPTSTILPMLPAADIATFFFYAIVAIYAIFTGVLYYHWNTYTSDKAVAALTYTAYFIITIPLMLTISGSIFLVN
jgi:hypothetical protein